MSIMSSHETIGWIITDNYVKDRMIDNSLIYKFTSSPKIRRRTKALNAKIKKYCGVKDYKQYVKLKTNVVRNIIEDTDTDNSGNLSDTDYDIIYSSLIQQNKHSIDDPERYIFTEKDCEDFERKINSKEKNNIKNIKASTPKRKLSQPTCNTRSSKKCINIKNIAKVETIASENSKDVNNDNILEKQNNEKEKNSSRSNLINKKIKNQKISLTNQENKTKFVKAEKSIQKQQSLSLKKNDAKKGYSKSCDNILEEDSREEESSDGKVRNFLQLNEIDKDAEIYLINQEDKNGLLNQSIVSYKNMHSMESENSSDNHKQQSLFPKEDQVKDVHSKSCDNILEEQNNREESSDGKITNSLQLNEIDKDGEIYPINHEDKNDLLNQSTDFYKKMHSTEPEDLSDIHEEQLLFPKEDRVKDIHSKSCDNILKEQDSRKEESFEEEITNFFQSNQIDKDTEISINYQDEKHSVKLKDSCNIEKQQFSPKITYSEIINKKYTIINKQDNNINIEKNDINSQKEMSKVEELDNNVLMTTLEIDSEEDNANYMSPEIKKRLQQQAKLNLVVNSDSSQSNDEYITSKTSKKFDDSDTSSDDSHDSDTKDMLENDETNCKKIDTDILHNKDNICSKETIPVPTKEKEDSPNIKKIRKEDDKIVLLTNCTYENNNLSKSTASKSSLKEIQYCENVYNNDDNQNESFIEEEESFQLRVSENNISCINEESINQFSKNNSLLDKENFCDKSNQSEDRMSDYTSELGARCKPRHEQKKQVSTNHSNVQLNISSYRPHNLQQLVEDEKLLAETIPASFMLADICEDDEAFILNVPNNVLQCNLQGQLLSLKEKTIKFGETKYRIVRRKMGTVSCIFATGKQRRPYKIVNIKKISTITVREKLSHCLKSDISNSYNISFESESNINNKLTNELQNTASKIKIDHNKRKRRSSDLETEQFVSTKRTKKERLKLIHS